MTIQKAIEQQTIEAERATTRHIELVQAIRNLNQVIADLRRELVEAGVLDANVRELK